MIQMIREEMASAADNGSPIDQKILFEKPGESTELLVKFLWKSFPWVPD